MRETEDIAEFAATAMDTPMKALCVKKKGYGTFDDVPHQFGLLVSPEMPGRFYSQDGLNDAMTNMKPATVVVCGHAWPGETPFVWTGSWQEFNSTWTLD